MKILYVFKRPVESLVKEINEGKNPNDSLYGMLHVTKNFQVAFKDSIFYRSKALQAIQMPFTKIAIYFTGIGFSLIPVICLIKKIKHSDIIFTTLDTVGLPVLLLKYFKIINRPVVYSTIGLEHNLLTRKSKIVRIFYGKLLKLSDKIVSVGSKDECLRLSKYLGLPISKFVFCPFGVDEKYFSPSKVKEEKYILSIGADKQRDWKTLINAADNFRLPLIIVCAKGVLDKNLVKKKLTVYEDLPIEELKALMARAKLIVITLKQSSYFSGQTTFFQAMSMEKSVVITKIFPLVDYKQLKDGFNCSLVKINDERELTLKVNKLISDKKARIQIGKNARKFILSNYSVKKFGSRLSKIFESVHRG